jgi:hypothetical protein
MESGRVTHVGRVDFRNDDRVFGIKHEDRFSHVYVIGKTGTGKSTLLETMALQDLECGNGFALIDPHGDLVARIAARIPASQRDRVVYLDATDPAQPYGYNPLRHVSEDHIALAASGMMDVFKKMWPDAWGVRMEHILRNVLIALLEQPNSTLHDVLKLFSDKQFRMQVALFVAPVPDGIPPRPRPSLGLAYEYERSRRHSALRVAAGIRRATGRLWKICRIFDFISPQTTRMTGPLNPSRVSALASAGSKDRCTLCSAGTALMNETTTEPDILK